MRTVYRGHMHRMCACRSCTSETSCYSVSKSVYLLQCVGSAAMFYYIIGNIPPQHRSTLAAIQLAAVVKHEHLTEYGIDTSLKPFIDAVGHLETVSGIVYCKDAALEYYLAHYPIPPGYTNDYWQHSKDHLWDFACCIWRQSR